MLREPIEDEINGLLLFSDSKLSGLYDRKQEDFGFRRGRPGPRFLDPDGLQFCECSFGFGFEVMGVGIRIRPV